MGTKTFADVKWDRPLHDPKRKPRTLRTKGGGKGGARYPSDHKEKWWGNTPARKKTSAKKKEKRNWKARSDENKRKLWRGFLWIIKTLKPNIGIMWVEEILEFCDWNGKTGGNPNCRNPDRRNQDVSDKKIGKKLVNWDKPGWHTQQVGSGRGSYIEWRVRKLSQQRRFQRAHGDLSAYVVVSKPAIPHPPRLINTTPPLLYSSSSFMIPRKPVSVQSSRQITNRISGVTFGMAACIGQF